MASQKKKLESFHFLHMHYAGSMVNLDQYHHSLWCLLSALENRCSEFTERRNGLVLAES